MPFRVQINEVCVNCGTELTVLKNGAFIYLVNSDAYLSCDVKGCLDCGYSICAGLAQSAVEAKHFPIRPVHVTTIRY